MNEEKTAPQKNASDDHELNWEAIRQHLTESNTHLTEIEEMDEETLQAAWARRATQIAATLQEDEQGERLEIAHIRLGHELYGLDVQYIFDIRPLEGITRVPRVPAWVAGVVNLRGHIISVLDLQRFLDLPTEEGKNNNQHLILVQTPRMEVALLTDAVLAVESLPVNRIQEATGVIRGIPAEYVQGVVNQNGHASNGKNGQNYHNLLVLLDLPTLLADPKLIVHEEII